MRRNDVKNAIFGSLMIVLACAGGLAVADATPLLTGVKKAAVQGADLSLSIEVRDAHGKTLNGREIAKEAGPSAWVVVRSCGSQPSLPCRVAWFVVGEPERNTPGFQPVVYTVEVPALSPGKQFTDCIGEVRRDDVHVFAAGLIGREDGQPYTDASASNNTSKREVLLTGAR